MKPITASIDPQRAPSPLRAAQRGLALAVGGAARTLHRERLSRTGQFDAAERKLAGVETSEAADLLLIGTGPRGGNPESDPGVLERAPHPGW